MAATPADGNENVDRSQIEKFLTNCIDLLKSDATRKTLKEDREGRPGIKIHEMQKTVWDEIGVAPKAGQNAIHRLPELYPDDHADLVALREKFANAVDETYLQSLEDRRPSTLKTSGKMKRNHVLEFLDACCVKYDAAEVRDRLRAEIQTTGAMPDSVLNEVHDEVMELLGFERKFGQNCFKEFGSSKEFAQDREMAVAYARWRGKTSNVCLKLIYDYRKSGGEVKVTDDVYNKLIGMQANEELDAMTPEERAALIEKNVNKVNIFHKLPPEGRQRYLDRLGENEKMELAKSEVLIQGLLQSQQHKKLAANQE
eukprot:TRINITY_DN83613_c0_g1_i1.p1 TRINITY_DN83613_c0_g1~~TRINITY_DN83613_c0_g1_i1.p1  ORF type:complete len:325 (+),score=62.59 TRINITY_DN83613_c0_g1_i1:38-976(+)